jgi:hypothetical protein
MDNHYDACVWSIVSKNDDINVVQNQSRKWNNSSFCLKWSSTHFAMNTRWRNEICKVHDEYNNDKLK